MIAIMPTVMVAMTVPVSIMVVIMIPATMAGL
jgi:hypothetical protein